MRRRFQEAQQWVQLHNLSRLHCLIAGVVCFFEALFLIGYERIAHIHAHGKNVADLSTAFEGVGAEAKHRDEEVAWVDIETDELEELYELRFLATLTEIDEYYGSDV